MERQYKALVLGWWGSAERALQRFVALHKESGALDVVVLTTSTGSLLRPQRALQEALAAFEGGDPVVVHVFSNGGMLLYLQLLDTHPELRSRIAGAIFDSTPGRFDLWTLLGAIKANVDTNVQTAIDAGSMLLIFLALRLARKRPALALVLLGLYEALTWRVNRLYHLGCVEAAKGAASLFLFSAVDHLVNHWVVEAISDKVKAANPTGLVQLKKWEDTNHVAHFKGRPEEYQAEVTSFLGCSG